MTVVTDAPVVLAHDRPETAVLSSRKPNVIGCAVQLGASDNDVCPLRPLFTVIAAQTGGTRVDLHFVAHFGEPLDKKPLVAQTRFELSIFRHFHHSFSQPQYRCLSTGP